MKAQLKPSVLGRPVIFLRDSVYLTARDRPCQGILSCRYRIRRMQLECDRSFDHEGSADKREGLRTQLVRTRLCWIWKTIGTHYLGIETKEFGASLGFWVIYWDLRADWGSIHPRSLTLPPPPSAPASPCPLAAAHWRICLLRLTIGSHYQPLQCASGHGIGLVFTVACAGC